MGRLLRVEDVYAALTVIEEEAAARRAEVAGTPLEDAEDALDRALELAEADADAYACHRLRETIDRLLTEGEWILETPAWCPTCSNRADLPSGCAGYGKRVVWYGDVRADPRKA